MVQNNNRPNGMNGQEKIPLVEGKVIRYKVEAEKAKQPNLFPSSEPPTTFTMEELEAIKYPEPTPLKKLQTAINKIMDPSDPSMLNNVMFGTMGFQLISHAMGFGQLLVTRGIPYIVGCLIGTLGGGMLEYLMHLLLGRGFTIIPFALVAFSGGFGFYAWHELASKGTFEFWFVVALAFLPPTIIFELGRSIHNQRKASELNRKAERSRKAKALREWKEINVKREDRGLSPLPMPEELKASTKPRGRSISAYEELVIVNEIVEKSLWNRDDVCKAYKVEKTKAYELIGLAYRLRDAKKDSNSSVSNDLRNLRTNNQTESVNPSQNSIGGKN